MIRGLANLYLPAQARRHPRHTCEQDKRQFQRRLTRNLGHVRVFGSLPSYCAQGATSGQNTWRCRCAVCVLGVSGESLTGTRWRRRTSKRILHTRGEMSGPVYNARAGVMFLMLACAHSSHSTPASTAAASVSKHSSPFML